MTIERSHDAMNVPGYEGQRWQDLVAELNAQLARRVRKRAQLPLWCAWITPEGVSVIPIAEAISRLRVAGLFEHARTIARSNAPAGHIQAWMESESGDACGLAFLAVRL